MGKHYRLRENVINCTGVGNKVIEDHDIHDESEFENPTALVKAGFLEEVEVEDSDNPDDELLKLVEAEDMESIKAIVGDVDDDELLKLVEAKDIEGLKALIKPKEKAKASKKK